MKASDEITKRALDDAYQLLQHEAVNKEISSTFYGSVREKISREKLGKLVVSKPDKYAGTSLARAISSFGAGWLYPGKVTLYKPFFEDFNIEIGVGEQNTA